MKNIIDKIKEYNKIILIMHLRPDGDCYGSSFGLKHAILDNFPGKTVYVLGEQLSNKRHLGLTDTISDSEFTGSLVISLDTGTKHRVYDKRFDTGEFLIRIDHHVHIEFFGDIDYVDTSSPATSYIIAKMLFENDIIVNKKSAECLFTGIITDTGRYRYRGVNNETHELVAKLIATGLDQQALFEKLYIKTIDELMFEGECLNLIETSGDVIYMKIPETLIKKYSLDDPVVAEYISLLEDIDGYPIWVLFYESNNRIRCRIRSKSIPVNLIANKYYGGGHKFASGAIFKTWDDTKNLINDLNKKHE